MNSVNLIGRLTSDAELKSSNGGSYARFRLAGDRMKREQGADFISCVIFGKSAETLCKYTSKGNRIGVIGRIQTGDYTDRNGNKVYTTEVVVSNFEFLEPKKQSEDFVTASDFVGVDLSAEAPAFMPVDDIDLPF